MSILSKLFGNRTAGDTKIKAETKPEFARKTLSKEEIFNSPDLLSQYVLKNIVEVYSVEDELNRAPGDYEKERYDIGQEQIERFAREESILRATGASIFIKQNYPDSFYISYFSQLYKPVAEHIYKQPTKEQVSDTRDALEEYIKKFVDGDDDQEYKTFQLRTQYMQNVYGDNPNKERMILLEYSDPVIFSTSMGLETMRKVTTGFTYEEAQKAANILNKN